MRNLGRVPVGSRDRTVSSCCRPPPLVRRPNLFDDDAANHVTVGLVLPRLGCGAEDEEEFVRSVLEDAVDELGEEEGLERFGLLPGVSSWLAESHGGKGELKERGS